MPISKEEVETYRRQLAVDAAVAAVNSLAINQALRAGSFPGDEASSGYYDYDDDGNPVYQDYFKAGDVVGLNAVKVV